MDERWTQFARKLQERLAGRLAEPTVQVIPSEFYKVMILVVSPTFEGMDEADRQEIVWDCVLNDFDVTERRQIEFIYTDAPSEREPEPVAEGTHPAS